MKRSSSRKSFLNSSSCCDSSLDFSGFSRIWSNIGLCEWKDLFGIDYMEFSDGKWDIGLIVGGRSKPEDGADLYGFSSRLGLGSCDGY